MNEDIHTTSTQHEHLSLSLAGQLFSLVSLKTLRISTQNMDGYYFGQWTWLLVELMLKGPPLTLTDN